MKTALFALSLALLGAPVAVLAQGTPAQAPPAYNGQRMQAMQQMRQLHEQTRLAVLNALSPSSRNLLASVVGQLAIAPNPDYNAAAARLDASLSPNEKNAILSAEQNMRNQMRTLHEQLRAQSGEAPEQGAHQYNPAYGAGTHMRGSMTAGRVLLMMAQGHGPERPMGAPGAVR